MMIKIIFQIIIILTLFQSCKGQTDDNVLRKTNYIDSIRNSKQIVDLISKIDNNYEEYKVNKKVWFTNKNINT